MAFALSTMSVTSPAFEQHGTIPARFTAEGDDVSPPLAWADAPDGTMSFAVLCHDPDAPLVKNGSYGYVHWLLYDLPARRSDLDEATGEGTAGTNDAGATGYAGPNPPAGHGRHHYYFWVLALDGELGLPPGAELATFLRAAEPHLLGMNRLVGTYRID